MEKTVPAFNTGFRELYPLFCGFEDCAGGHAFGPAVREFYLIHYVRGGKGTFSARGQSRPVTAGQCFLIRPQETTLYRADDTDPWRYTWIAFSGERAAAMLQGLPADGEPVFGGGKIPAVFDELYRQIADGSLDGFGNELSMLAVLYSLFAALPRQGPVGSQRDLYVQKARNYVHKMIANPLSVESLAAYCGLDRHYLCRIFKAQTGLSLQAYVLDCRMRKAREMLTHSSLSVGDVARSVGYADPYNFSKMFKKHFGRAPALLRKSESAR